MFPKDPVGDIHVHPETGGAGLSNPSWIIFQWKGRLALTLFQVGSGYDAE